MFYVEKRIGDSFKAIFSGTKDECIAFIKDMLNLKKYRDNKKLAGWFFAISEVKDYERYYGYTFHKQHNISFMLVENLRELEL